MPNRITGYRLETGTRWAVLIGVSGYQASRGFSPLPCAVADVDVLARLLASGPTPFRIRRLIDHAGPDQRPTLANMKVEIRRLVEHASPGDLILFYFSGHGLSRGERSYLMPLDGHRDLPEETALPLDWLRSEFSSAVAAIKLMVLDACYMGPPGKGLLLDPEGSFEQPLLLPFRGSAVLTSCRHEEVSAVWEERGMSVFTHYLVKGLERDAADSDQVVTLSHLFAHLSERVRAWAFEAGRGRQTPVLLAEIEGEVPLRRIEPPPSSPPPIQSPAWSEDRRGPPFRFLSPFTERDAADFFGREGEIRVLLEMVLYYRHVVIFAPSGTGKTSLMRAGLLPALREAGAEAHYVACREDPIPALLLALKSPENAGSEALGSAVARRLLPGKPLVLILDQLEMLLLDPRFDADSRRSFIRALTTLSDPAYNEKADVEPGCTLVLSVREDFLYLLHALSQALDIGPHQEFVLHPMRRAQAEQVLEGALTGRRVSFSPALRSRLLDDLEASGRRNRRGRQSFEDETVFPPHLQILGTALYRSLRPQDTVLDLDRYESLGGMEGIFATYLERALDELEPATALAARDLCKALTGSGGTRRTQGVDTLVRKLQKSHGHKRVMDAADLLEERRLLSRVTVRGEACWELAHDLLVEHLATWIDAQEAERRVAFEVLRTFSERWLRGDQEPLDLKSCRRILAWPGLFEELLEDSVPSRAELLRPIEGIVLAARRRHLLSRGAYVAALIALVTLVGVVRALGMREEQRAAANIGRFQLELVPFDWDPRLRQASPVSARALPGLDWTLYRPDAKEAHRPGTQVKVRRVRRTWLDAPGAPPSLLEEVEASGGPHLLRVTGRGMPGQSCAPAWIRLASLPGYSELSRAELQRILLFVPTCSATTVDTIEIPLGPFFSGGPGEPPLPGPMPFEPEREQTLLTYRIDRTEVTNAAYRHYASMSAITGRTMPVYPAMDEYRGAEGDAHPVAYLDWVEAFEYCRFLGKELPTSLQWEKAARGGRTLDEVGSRPNPFPRRSTPWAGGTAQGYTNLWEIDSFVTTSPVDAFPQEVSPYGVLGLAGNVREWLADTVADDATGKMRHLRGGHFFDNPKDNTFSVAFVAHHDMRFVEYATGLRCVIPPGVPAAPAPLGGSSP